MQTTTVSNRRQHWRRSLLLGLAAAILSLMLGLLLQTLVDEVARNIPALIRQDAHISLPLCRLFPDLYGCDPWIGALTTLEIWERSVQIGQIGGLLAGPLLVATFAAWHTIRLRPDTAIPGLLTGIAGLFASLLAAIAFDVPLSPHTLPGIFAILLLLSLPLSGLAGGRFGRARLARRPPHRAVYFLPAGESVHTAWTGEPLTPRELEVLALVAEGLTNRQIARRLYISKATVKTHLIHIFGKLQVENRTAAVTRALAAGLLQQARRSYPEGHGVWNK